ncbi:MULTISPECIES: ABC transporter permease [Paenibacillus]|uniref:Multiple-sugar transport system permease YteP n=1 Tax=Paenibacillus cineris TaxID=237530 RepID=A0ABQ4L8T4_9BACL|nr:MULTISPECIES: ABC transporter permease subunit [Paenibacillus]RED37308.1 putative aldouronate transport system permease protein [Paenibacillus sp. VMFN-D1]GIO52715.1 putative multiple-sugar transport system permease YteP [Paenibacillus cineris]
MKAYWKRAFPIYLMILPGLLYFIIFKYIPMFGISIAFMKYSPFKGIMGSEWVGLHYFRRLFAEGDFLLLLKNTLLLNLLDVLFFFPAPILVALLLNELRARRMKAAVQTILYAPNFISWVVIVGITIVLFATGSGGINQLLEDWGLGPIELMTDPRYFRWVWLLQNIWQGAGWGAIIFLAALSGIDPTLYEAAKMDGANRWRQVWHITLPGLRGVIVVMFILRFGHMMDLGFEHIFLLQNPMNQEVSEVFETFIYKKGLIEGDYSYSTAVGLFKSVVGLVLVWGVNRLAKRFGQEGVF